MSFFLSLLFWITLAASDEIYENSTSICDRCTCTKSADAQTLTLDCQKQGFHHILGDWPPCNATLIAIFSENNIATLQTLPPTDAAVEITLDRCNIQYLYPGLFDATKNIKMVDLSYNFLKAEEITRDKFLGPYRHTKMEPIKLEDLSLAYNQIHSLNKDVFDNLPYLKRLNLEGNDFVVLDQHTQLALSSITGLVSLNLADNELTEVVKHALENYKNLVELDLSRNELDFVPASLVAVGKTLEILKLDDNPIIEFNNESFVGLGSLNELSANNLTLIKRIKAGTFAPMPKLRKLSLSDNRHLEEIDEKAFSPNQSLRLLYLNNNSLTHLSFRLLDWSKLDVCEFKNNPLDCSCDLHNISGVLSRNDDAPYCLDPRNDRPLEIKQLKSDICTAKAQSAKRILYHHFSIPLAGLTATLVLSMLVAMTLARTKCKQFFNKNSPDGHAIYYRSIPTTNVRC